MTAEQLRNSILQEAISGRLVPQDPNDEPVSVLLEKIREEKARLIKEGKLKKEKPSAPITDDEKPFEIPASWEWVRVQDIVQINPKNIADDNIDAAFIPMELIDATYYSSFTYKVRKWKEIKSGFTHFANGDIAFAKITPCFQNRKSMILHDLPNGIGAGTTELKVLRTYGGTIVDFYLLFFLETAYFVEQAEFKGTANQQRIISGYLENKLFPLPPLAEQKRIVAKLEELLPIVEQYGKAQAELDELNAALPARLRQSVLQQAIQGKLVPQDEKDEPFSSLEGQIEEAKKKQVEAKLLSKSDLKRTLVQEEEIPFEIPSNWCWYHLHDVANMYTGNSINTEEKLKYYTNVTGREYIGTKDVKFNHEVDYNNGISIPIERQDKFRIAPKNSILLCVEGGSAGRKIATIDRDVCFGNKLCCFTPYLGINDFLYYYLQSPLFRDVFRGSVTGIIGGVSIKNLKDLVIPLPPLAEQKRIVAKIEELFAEIDKLK